MMSRDTQADYKSMKPYIDIAEKAKTDADNHSTFSGKIPPQSSVFFSLIHW